MSLFRWCRLAADWRIFAVSFSRVIRLDLVQLASVCGSCCLSCSGLLCSLFLHVPLYGVGGFMDGLVHIVFSCIDGSGNGRRLVIYGAFCSMWHITQ
ncbi:hypothetical protein HID58_033944 [Brassica napus]|uniref:Uncharacterized protein n=1 Tax=Brassica napus TaxID=3708 RepID=A0ABQ8C0W9_BRANA|nr:hypothetical protein HID58_033944 [Brassica napus]